MLRKLAWQVGDIVKQTEAKDVDTHVELENSDLIVRPDSVQAARVGLTSMDVESQISAALYGQVASTLPQQDRITNIRVRYPDAVRYDRQRLERPADQPGRGRRHWPPVFRRALRRPPARPPVSSSCARWPRSKSNPVPTSCGARTSSR